jgi:hypothetical protein
MSTQADRIIAKFGTQQGLADAIKVRQSTVAAWKKRGFIPMRQAGPILDAAKASGVELAPEDFFETKVA